MVFLLKLVDSWFEIAYFNSNGVIVKLMLIILVTFLVRFDMFERIVYIIDFGSLIGVMFIFTVIIIIINIFMVLK